MASKDHRNETADARTLNRRSVLLGGTTLAAATAITVGKPARSVPMSHHLDTPLAAQNGQLYIDDLYVFSGNDSTVFILDVNSNITGVHVKPGFHPEARYEFKVHFDGADFETLTYRISFGEPDSDGRQSLKLHALTGKYATEDSANGNLVLEGETG